MRSTRDKRGVLRLFRLFLGQCKFQDYTLNRPNVSSHHHQTRLAVKMSCMVTNFKVSCTAKSFTIVLHGNKFQSVIHTRQKVSKLSFTVTSFKVSFIHGKKFHNCPAHGNKFQISYTAKSYKMSCMATSFKFHTRQKIKNVMHGSKFQSVLHSKKFLNVIYCNLLNIFFLNDQY